MVRVFKRKPLISIIVPVYNCEKYIENTLENLLKIDCDKEIIIINDCSKDNSLNKLKKYQNEIKLIDLEENHGASYARNVGLDNATGKYVGFVDADDSFEPSMFSTMLKKVEKEKAAVCVCNYDEFFENSDDITPSKYDLNIKTLDGKEGLKLFLLDKISPAIWDKIYERKLLENIRFNEKLFIGEDILFCLNVFFECKNITFVNEYMYHYLQQDTSLMHTVSKRLLHFKEVIKNIDSKKVKYLEKNNGSEFEYFKLEMVTRGIHSLSTLKNKNNKKEVKKYLKEYCNKEDLNKILKSEYYSKSIKLEILVLRLFGINIHLLLMPIYKKIRNYVRKNDKKK